MTGKTEREAIMQDLKREILRCRRIMESISDKRALQGLGAYLGDLERALEGRERENTPDSTIDVRS